MHDQSPDQSSGIGIFIAHHKVEQLIEHVAHLLIACRQSFFLPDGDKD